MSLTPGTKLGPYEILAPLGAGGMGEVYKAKDTRLDRTVAIKVLPSHVASNPEVRQRFEREARAVSSLNHPHICTLYDIGSENGIDFMVMEHIEGDTLADRLKKGALPLDQALRYGIEMADALDKAHRQGVVHRDLKPGNIMLTKSGAKLLDFGLAKMTAEQTNVAGLSALPTEAKPLTQEGSILGTFQYMAPEQLEGKEADARTDIFAFGAVTYEMLTGKRAFEGKSQASLIGAIMTSEPPPISQLQAMSPPALDHVVRTCLAKDPDERWQTAGDVGRQLSWITEGGSEAGISAPVSLAGRRISRRLGVGIISAMISALVAGIAVWNLRSLLEPGRVVRLAVTLPTNEEVALEGGRHALALSPDGSHLVYAARGEGGRQLYLRSLGEPDAAPIPGTEDASSPFFSPDGEWMGFFADGQLKKVTFGGGAPITVCETESMVIRGASWGADDHIVFSLESPSGLRRVPASGGIPEMLTTPDSEKGEFSHRWPYVLPGGRAVIFTIETRGSFDEARIVVQILETGERRILVDGGADASYVPTGHLVYGRAGALLAVPFDLSRLTVTGHPVQVLDGVVTNPPTGATYYAFSNDGTLAYLRGGPMSAERKLVWVDREGNAKPLREDPGNYGSPRLSPDGSKVAVRLEASNDDVWIYDLARDTLTRLTVEASEDGWSLAWTPKGDRLTFNSDRAGGMSLFWKPVDGSGPAEQLTTSEYLQYPDSWSPDGNWLVFTEHHPVTRADLWVLPNEGERTPEPWLQTPFQESAARFSPDGSSVAYVSDESGRYEVYVRPFPGPGAKSQISTQGGVQPVWSRDGQELFYRNEDRLMAVDVTMQPAFRAGKPRPLFEGRYWEGYGPGVDSAQYDVSTDGQRFVMIQRGQEPERRHINVVLNWFEELKRLVPKKKN